MVLNLKKEYNPHIYSNIYTWIEDSEGLLNVRNTSFRGT